MKTESITPVFQFFRSIERVGGVALSLTLAFSVLGCSTTWIDPTAPDVVADPTRVVVSDFFQLQQAASITQSWEIRTIREEVNASEISFIVASLLKQGGVDAIAIEDGSADELAEGEVLVRGAFVGPAKAKWVRWWPQLFWISTIAIWGGILPMPYTAVDHCVFPYRFDVTESSGRILYQFEGDLVFRKAYLWLWQEPHCPNHLKEGRERAIHLLGSAFENQPR